MKKLLFAILITVILVVTLTLPAFAKKDNNIDTIVEGEVLYSPTHYLAGQAIPTGFDIFGYNYQGHMFKGSYYNSYAGAAGYGPWQGDDVAYLAEFPAAASHWAWPYRDVKLAMKWNDAWLSNADRDQNGALDRYWGFTSYIGSGAWLTNHQSGDNTDGTNWNYFVKIVAAPADANAVGGIWYAADGTEIGSVIWGSFAVIQQVENDPMADLHGAQYISPYSAGFGAYAP